MSVSLVIDSIERASSVDWRSLRREKVLTKEPDYLRFSVRRHPGRQYRPEVGDEVSLTIGGTKEFGGYVVEISESIEGMVETVQVICKDYTHELDRSLVSRVYESMTVSEIISAMIAEFAPSFTTAGVDCEVPVDKVVFNYLPVSKCLQKLTEIVGFYDWYVDYEKDIRFFLPDGTAAPFSLSDDSGDYVFGSMVIRKDTHQIRNEIIVRGGLLTSESERTEKVIGNPGQVLFPLATKFAELPAVTINGSSVTVGVENVDLEGFQSYWNYGEKSIRLVSAVSSTDTSIELTALYQYPLILQKRSESSISQYGLYQYVLTDKTIRDLDTASLRADSELLKYAFPAMTANFITYTDGLDVGQTVAISSAIRDVSDEFKVQMIRTQLKTPDGDDMVHEIEAITADDIGINDVLTRLLLTNPSDQIDIENDEVIVRIRTASDSVSVSDSASEPVTTSPPYYVGSTAVMGFSTVGV